MAKRRKTPADLIDERAVPLPAWINPYSDDDEEEPEKRLPCRPKGSTKLQYSWDRAIIALLTIPTVEGAAEAVGVSKATLYNWLKDPEFSSQLNEIRRHGMLQAVFSIYGSMGKTMQTLMDLRDDKNQPGAIRLGACKELTQLWIKFYDQEKAEELVSEKMRELRRMLDEIETHETDTRDREDQSGSRALTDGSDRETTEGDGEAGARAPGAGEGETDLGF